MKTLSYQKKVIQMMMTSQVEIAQKDVPSAVFGGLVRKRDEADNDAEAQDATALERIKRQKKA